nr:MAG TPA: hypothetical protein [Caudoviricetes sp.]
MDKAKKLIIDAVRELRKEPCECDNHTTCTRCIAIIRLNSIHNFLCDRLMNNSKY